MNARLTPQGRLPFTLPDFTRHSWVSEAARSQWEPRIARIVRAWSDVEWRSVAAGVRDCALLWLDPKELPSFIAHWEADHLSAIPLQVASADAPSAKTSGLICVLVGALDRVRQLQQAWSASSDEAVGTLLGYPPCCRTFFHDVWVEQRCVDTTWAMALNTAAGAASETVRITASRRELPLANILWRWMGVRAVPHLPCRFDCAASVEFGARMLEVARRAGYSPEVDWVVEILSWPIEWSALHGIAEVKSPIMKVSTRTDATAAKCCVQWLGMRFPAEGAIGVRFPYQPPVRRRLTQSVSYQRGLEHAPPDAAPANWRYADNGFSSEAAMEALHHPIVALAQSVLPSEGGNVLDLGCGNGILLEKICAGQSKLTPYGIDTNGAAIERARQLLPAFAENFRKGDLFDSALWSHGARDYALALLMLGRLLEVPRDVALSTLDRLRASCSRVLVYVYPDWSKTPLSALAAQLGLSLDAIGSTTAALLSAVDRPDGREGNDVDHADAER